MDKRHTIMPSDGNFNTDGLGNFHSAMMGGQRGSNQHDFRLGSTKESKEGSLMMDA